MTTTQKLRGLADVVKPFDPSMIPLERQTILLYGEPKIGKTTLASKFKNAIFCDTEDGTLNFNVPTFERLLGRERSTEPIKDWSDIRKATNVLAGIENIEGVVVVDTTQEAFNMCREHVLKTLGVEHETDAGYGKGWRSITDEFSSWIRQLKGLGLGLVFISHETEFEVETPTMKFQKKSPRMDKGCKSIIEPMVNMIWYAHNVIVDGAEQQVIRTKGSLQVTAGERGDNPRLPTILPMDYKKIKEAWDGKPAAKEK